MENLPVELISAIAEHLEELTLGGTWDRFSHVTETPSIQQLVPLIAPSTPPDHVKIYATFDWSAASFMTLLSRALVDFSAEESSVSPRSDWTTCKLLPA
jgi:hypothetical protein